MFLSRRATQAEYFDLPGRTFAEVADGYRWLNRVNRILQNAEPFRRVLPGWLGAARCRSLTVLDLGSGDGALGRSLAAWAAQRGWEWRVTNLDLNPLALRLSSPGCSVAGSVVDLPFRDRSFDLVIASTMTHHLDHDAEVVRHFAEAWRVTRDALFIHDVHRNIGLYAALWLLLLALRVPVHFRADGLLSVARGWRVKEFRSLAQQAGIVDAQVRLDFGSRMFLRARRASLTIERNLSVGGGEGRCRRDGLMPADAR